VVGLVYMAQVAANVAGKQTRAVGKKRSGRHPKGADRWFKAWAERARVLRTEGPSNNFGRVVARGSPG